MKKILVIGGGAMGSAFTIPSLENKNNVNDLKKHVKLLHEKFTKLATKK